MTRPEDKAWEEFMTPGKIIWTDDKSSQGLTKAGFLAGYAAHDKAVREAVEEFRERAARVCEDSVTWWPNRNMNECTKTPPELAAAIRALPVEGK